MEDSPQVTESLIGMGSEVDNISSGWMPTDDQFFLLYFIMGTYFAPDLKGEMPQKSFWQRHAEGLPPYTSDQLAGSCIRTVEIERVYYYVLRKADQSVIVKLPWLHRFFHGNIPTPALGSPITYPQFNDLFPPHLHPHSLFKGQYGVVNNIVFINDPETFYISPEYIERFKRLTKVEDFHLDRDGARLHTFVEGEVLFNVDVQEVEFNGEITPVASCASQKTTCSNNSSKPEDPTQHAHAVKPVNSLPYVDTPPICSLLHNGTPVTPQSSNGASNGHGTPPMSSYGAHLLTEGIASPSDKSGSDMLFLPSRPTREEWIKIMNATKTGSALTGSAAMGQIGTVLGLIDIGECEDSYLFRVSLPGVKRDEREFSCEVENDGKVSIRGVTVAGEKTVCRYRQMFEMQSQNFCPPGHFSISFKLPGPVDPLQFSGNFGTDGILEGIVMKEGQVKAITW